MEKIKIIFNEEFLSLKGKNSYLKFVLDDLSKKDKYIKFSVYTDAQRIHRDDSYAVRLRILDGKLRVSSQGKLKHLLEAYEFEALGFKGIEKELKEYISKKDFVFWQDRVNNFISKYHIEGTQLKELLEII